MASFASVIDAQYGVSTFSGERWSTRRYSRPTVYSSAQHEPPPCRGHSYGASPVLTRWLATSFPGIMSRSGAAPFSVSTTGVMTVVYCAIFPTVICFTMQNTFQRYVTPTRAGLIYTLDPVWSLLAGLFVLGEHLKPLEWLGCGLIFLAALLPLTVRYLYERRLVQQYAPDHS